MQIKTARTTTPEALNANIINKNRKQTKSTTHKSKPKYTVNTTEAKANKAKHTRHPKTTSSQQTETHKLSYNTKQTGYTT